MQTKQLLPLMLRAIITYDEKQEKQVLEIVMGPLQGPRLICKQELSVVFAVFEFYQVLN